MIESKIDALRERKPIPALLGLGQSLKSLVRPQWPRAFAQDLARYRRYRPGCSAWIVFATEQGLWALLQYRIASAIYSSDLPQPFKRMLLIVMTAWQKLIEILTGVSLPYAASLGPGLYIGHFGNIIVNEATVMGSCCNLSQGVTIGVSGRGEKRGVPVIGDRVYIGANAVVAGKIEIGDDAVIAANSLVSESVPPSATMIGVPAKVVNFRGSGDYIDPRAPRPESKEDDNDREQAEMPRSAAPPTAGS
jgi:serine O-acetyltransferase